MRDIHPTDKQTVGRRLARLALHRVYGHRLVDTGPTPSLIESVDSGEVRITFNHATKLISRSATLEGFELAGVDGTFFPAAARIDGITVFLQCKEVTNPTALRYGYRFASSAGLYNEVELPAIPFAMTIK